MTAWSDPDHDVVADMRRHLAAYVDGYLRAGRWETDALLREALMLSDMRRLHRLIVVEGSWSGPGGSVASIWRTE